MSSPVTVPPSLGFAPGRLPLLGHALALRYRPLQFLDAQRSKGDIVVFWLGPSRAYLINSPDLIRQMLTTHRARFSKGGVIDIGRILTGDGLISADGELHRKQRRLIQPAFHPHHFPAYVAIMQETAVAKAESWQDNQVVTVDQEMHELSTATLVRCLYSGHLSDDTVGEVARALPVAFDGLGRRAALPFRWLHALPTPQNRRFHSAVNQLHRIVNQLIADHKASGADRDDVLSILLTARDEETGQTMSDQQIHDEIMTLLVAGSDTTAVTLSWALHVIGTHPGVENKIHTELQQVLGGRPVTHADFPRLDFLRRVVTEILRLYPAGWLVPRRAVTETDIGGHRIARGSYVFFSPYANHHDCLLFPDPENFDPDRWLPERAQPLPRCAYVPFGAGTRQCIGETFAVSEVIAALATILVRWRLRPHSDQAVRPHALTTLTPGRLLMTAERRKNLITS